MAWISQASPSYSAASGAVFAYAQPNLAIFPLPWWQAEGADSACGDSMDNTKLKNVIKKYQQHLVVDHGIGRNTVDGYARSLSIALRRMRKFAPKPAEIKQHILWMHTRNYSYSHIVNTSIAIEHYAKQRGISVKIGRPRKPRRVIKDILTESEVSRIIQSARNLREKAIVCLLAYSGMRNREVCNLMVRELDLGSNRVIVLAGKNKKDRIINISSDVPCTARHIASRPSLV